MQNFYSLYSSGNFGTFRLPDWNYVQDGLKRNLNTIVNYYQNSTMAVESDHFLVKLLQLITVPQSQNLDRYYDNVDAIALNMSMALKMTSTIYSGKIFDGIFYGEGCSEILVATDESFDIFDADKNWRNLCAVKVMRHPITNLGLDLPSGRKQLSDNNFAVINIHIPMLALQYRAYRLDQIEKFGEDGGDQGSAMNFIHMFVLPNMLYSHLDHVIFNRIRCLLDGKNMEEMKQHHPFYTTDYSDRLNRVQTKILEGLKNIDKDFVGELRSIPVISKGDVFALMATPEVAQTRQILWTMVISRLPVLDFLLTTVNGRPEEWNQSQINHLLFNIRQLKNDRSIQAMMPYKLYRQVQSEIDALVLKTSTS
jgi:hypothetical protein